MKEKVKTKSIKQIVVFKATPHELYEMLMDSKKHRAFSGETAKISKKEGGKVSAYGGWVSAKNLTLKPDRLIIQAWRGGNWPEGHYSKAVFLFTQTKIGTKLTFSQTKVPADKAKHIAKGWHDSYWNKMKAALDGVHKVSSKKMSH